MISSILDSAIGRSLRTGFALVGMVTLLVLFPVSKGTAHGTHVQFLEPKGGQTVSGNLDIRIAGVEHNFPYVFLTIKPFIHSWARHIGLVKNDSELWSGLVPVNETDYYQQIDISSWPEGHYEVEAQFIGDFVENVRSRRFVVEHKKTQ